LEGSPCAADGRSGIVTITTGTGGASVPITFACTKTPTVEVTFTGGALDINLRDRILGLNQECKDATSCVAAFGYGHEAVVQLASKASEKVPTFHYTCPPSSIDDFGAISSIGSLDDRRGQGRFSSITTDATVTVTIPDGRARGHEKVPTHGHGWPAEAGQQATTRPILYRWTER
jgi:hypothetical protein